MNAYAAFLRAINVGGHGILPMKQLVSIMNEAGYGNIKTHLQSGNVAFTSRESDETKLSNAIEDAIEHACLFRPSIFIRTRSELESVLASNPFFSDKTNLSRLITVFLRDAPDKASIARLDRDRFPDVQFSVAGRELYLLYDEGMGRSKFVPAYYERRLGTIGTARNWNTIVRIASLLAT